MDDADLDITLSFTGSFIIEVFYFSSLKNLKLRDGGAQHHPPVFLIVYGTQDHVVGRWTGFCNGNFRIQSLSTQSILINWITRRGVKILFS